MSDTAAAARAAYLGTDVIPWDELKPEMQDRWQRVVEVVEEASTPLSMCPLCYRCHNSIRVPFSDGVIEKMAREASYSIGGWGYDNWDKGIMRDAWRASVRRALAAGGLEPCAAPEYVPEDVAFPSERASDEELAKIGRAAGVWTMEWNELPDGNKKWWTACAAAVRARVEAPLLAEIARLEAEIATERDKANRFDATAQGLSDIVDGQKRDKDGLRNSLARVTSERDNLRAQLEAVTAERDEARQEQDNLIFQRNDFRHWHANEQKKVADLTAELAALRQPTSTPTDAEVEALARVLHKAQDGFYCRYGDHATKFDDYAPLWLACARAAYAHIGGVPVGWELDVTADVIEVIARSSSRQTRAKEILDLCRSRIKPVYECKECAKRPKNVVTSFNFTFNYDTGTWQVINCAALEGE